MIRVRQIPLNFGESGFSLMEVLVAMGLFSIAATAAVPAFVGHLKHNTIWERKTGAVSAVTTVLEELRVGSPTDLPLTGDADPTIVEVGGREFEVVLSYCENSSRCAAQAREITARAYYKDELMYEVVTVYAQLR